VSDSGAPSGPRTFAIYNPPVIDSAIGLRASYLKAAKRLTRDLIDAGVNTLVFTRSRRAVEILVRYLRDDLDEDGPADLDPEEALRKLVAFTVDYQLANPDFIRLVMNENIHRGEFLAQSTAIQKLNVPAIHAVKDVYQRGVKQGVFRPGLDPVDLHMSISALSFFNVANHHTFSLIFKRDLESPRAVTSRRNSIVEMVVRFVKK
jgi:hypothetical protein